MQFNTYIYILLFLPVTVVLYYLLNKINSLCGKVVLLLSSLLFYCYSDWTAILVLGASLAFNYIAAVCISRAKKWKPLYLVIPVLINVGLLLYFKYSNFAITNINVLFSRNYPLRELVLPLGISFFTFQQIAYITAVYRGELADRNLLDYLVYILYFPKILMGPLTEPVDFIHQLNDPARKSFHLENFVSGIKIFSLGLFKKVLLADAFARAVDWGYAAKAGTLTPMVIPTAMDWILISLFYTFEIYFDFSGYSDMAVGSSLMLNITLPINFDSPYKALSIRDFWKRWHISLTKFFTKYIYIPLGGSRRGIVFTCLNTMLVFLISGLWHGANWTFILWGALHGLFSVFDRLTEKVQQKIFEPVRWICTFAVVNVLWLLFRSESVQQWWKILREIVSLWNVNVSEGLINMFTEVLHFDFIANEIRGFWMNFYIAGAFGICLLCENNYRRLNDRPWSMMLISAAAFLLGLICLGSESVFVYFNF